MNASIDGFDFSFPAPLRWMMSLLMKKKMLAKSVPAGFKSTPKFTPGETSTEAGLASLEKSIERQKSESLRVAHPGFGKMRHAEMHMRFLVKVEDTGS